MCTPQLILCPGTGGQLKRVDFFGKRFTVSPACFQQSKTNAKSITQGRTVRCSRRRGPAASYIHSKFITTCNESTCFQHAVTEFRAELTYRNALADEMYLFQFSEKTCLLYVGFLAGYLACYPQPSYSSLGQSDEVFGGGTSIFSLAPLCPVCDPDGDSYSGNRTNRLNPSCGNLACQYINYFGQPKCERQQCQKHSSGNSEQDRPGRCFEILQGQILRMFSPGAVCIRA